VNYLQKAKDKIRNLENEGEMPFHLAFLHFALIFLYIHIDLAESQRASSDLYIKQTELENSRYFRSNLRSGSWVSGPPP